MEQRIVIPLKNGVSLVAEASTNPDFPCEIYVGLMKKTAYGYRICALLRRNISTKTATSNFQTRLQTFWFGQMRITKITLISLPCLNVQIC